MRDLPSLVVWCFGFIVPAKLRKEWMAEWDGELWDARKHGYWKTLSFSFGSLNDALWLRRNPQVTKETSCKWLRSPMQCACFLAVLAVFCLYAAFGVYSLSGRLLPSPYPNAQNLALISPVSRLAGNGPSMALADYLSLQSRDNHPFSNLAYYCQRTFPLRTPQVSSTLEVAISTENLFSVLQVPVASRPTGEIQGTLILSEAYWRGTLGGDPGIVGKRLQVGNLNLPVSGILPAKLWRLPGKIDAWWLHDSIDQAIDHWTRGFVVAQLLKQAEPWHGKAEWRVLVPDGNGGFARLTCESLMRTPLLRTHGLILLVAFVLFPVAFSLSLDRYPSSIAAHAFLALKLGLVIPSVFCAFFCWTSISVPEIQPHGLLAGYLLAMRWAVTDQRERCPVCLYRLQFPARIGWSSQTFLEWYGTELVCRHGHGMLHVPEIHTSCYGGQRWLPLDSSWKGLFAQTQPRNIL